MNLSQKWLLYLSKYRLSLSLSVALKTVFKLILLHQNRIYEIVLYSISNMLQLNSLECESTAQTKKVSLQPDRELSGSVVSPSEGGIVLELDSEAARPEGSGSCCQNL